MVFDMLWNLWTCPCLLKKHLKNPLYVMVKFYVMKSSCTMMEPMVNPNDPYCGHLIEQFHLKHGHGVLNPTNFGITILFHMAYPWKPYWLNRNPLMEIWRTPIHLRTLDWSLKKPWVNNKTTNPKIMVRLTLNITYEYGQTLKLTIEECWVKNKIIINKICLTL